MSQEKNRSFGTVATILLLAAATVGAQTSSPAIIGAWRADAPLPNGVVQTFRFDPDGKFDLAMALAVDGTYHVDGNQIIQTLTLPSVGVTHTDTATFTIIGDSLSVSDGPGAPTRSLRRSVGMARTSGIVGDWEIVVGGGTAAHYSFAPDGTMHVRAQVDDEQGKYTVNSDTLRLSNDKTFQLPATAQFAITGSVLTLTPLNGKTARQFHKVAPAP
ncbi:MAG TPA: DUF5640 domain-containing protein [Gemmatimonadaceae bacterium]